MHLQSYLISGILNPVGKLSQKLRPQTRDWLFLGGLLILFLQSFVHYSQIITYRYLITFSIGCVGMALMLFSLLTGELKPVRFRLLPTLLFMLYGCTILLSALWNKPDFLTEAVIVLVIYPVFYMVSAGHDAAHLYHLLIRGCELSFLFFAVISAAFFPVSATRYGGLFANVNMAAFYLEIVCVCFLVDIIYTDKITLRTLSKLVLGAISAALLFYTNSRTGVIAYLLALIAVLLLYLIPRRFRVERQFWFKLLLYILLTALAIAFILQIFYFINDLVLHLSNWVIKLFLADSSFSDPLSEHEALDLQSFIARTVRKAQVSGKDMDAVSTHRFTIWGKYLKALNFRGHSEAITNTVDYGYMTITSHTAHMTILQIAYDYGIHAGLLYLIFNLLTGVGTIVYALRQPSVRYSCFPIAITVLFGFTSLLASLTISFHYLLLFYYYLVQFPLMTKREAS